MAASTELSIILRDAAKTPLLRMTSEIASQALRNGRLAASRRMLYNSMVRDARKNALLTMTMRVAVRLKEVNPRC
jgi:hypothetical protein